MFSAPCDGVARELRKRSKKILTNAVLLLMSTARANVGLPAVLAGHLAVD